MVVQNRFREDLLYRINTFTLRIPPLRERLEDIADLANVFLLRYAKKYNKNCDSFSRRAEKKLLEHNWPGNIRELMHTIEKAVILCESMSVSEEELLINRNTKEKTEPVIKDDLTLEQIERIAIDKALRANDGNMSDTATALGVTRQTLYNKVKKYGL